MQLDNFTKKTSEDSLNLLLLFYLLSSFVHTNLSYDQYTLLNLSYQHRFNIDLKITGETDINGIFT